MTASATTESAVNGGAWRRLKIELAPHRQPGTLLAICGADGSGKTTLEEGLVAALGRSTACVAALAPTRWWRRDPNVRRTLFAEGDGDELPAESLMHFNFADCHALQADVILPALARGETVVCNRYVFDSLALFEARDAPPPQWLTPAASMILAPDACFVLDGSAQVLVDRVVGRDGANPQRFDQDLEFTERYNAALRRMAGDYDLNLLSIDAPRAELLQRCLAVIEAGRK